MRKEIQTKKEGKGSTVRGCGGTGALERPEERSRFVLGTVAGKGEKSQVARRVSTGYWDQALGRRVREGTPVRRSNRPRARVHRES